MDALGSGVRNQLGRGVVGVQLDLVDGGNDLAARVVQELLKVLDTEVGDADVLDPAGGREFLDLLPSRVLISVFADGMVEDSPSLDKVPVGKVLLGVVRVGRAGPVHQIEVDVVQAKALKGGFEALRNTVVPGVIQLGGDPDLTARDARISDTIADLGFIAICKSTKGISVSIVEPGLARCDSRINMAIALQQSILNGLTDLIGSRLPGTKPNGRDLGPGVKGEGLPLAQNNVQYVYLDSI